MPESSYVCFVIKPHDLSYLSIARSLSFVFSLVRAHIFALFPSLEFSLGLHKFSGVCRKNQDKESPDKAGNLTQTRKSGQGKS